MNFLFLFLTETSMNLRLSVLLLSRVAHIIISATLPLEPIDRDTKLLTALYDATRKMTSSLHFQSATSQDFERPNGLPGLVQSPFDRAVDAPLASSLPTALREEIEAYLAVSGGEKTSARCPFPVPDYPCQFSATTSATTSATSSHSLALDSNAMPLIGQIKLVAALGDSVTAGNFLFLLLFLLRLSSL
jgi:hypothetical protein